ncbi:hypothetical protein GCM10010412_009870 [Nonomuraea recticatena]|uniref:Cell division protein FtsI n=2 Tax=Nonomuraea recticatena TaxID=46178 RepID=A0ABN3R955_9ACTN
MSGMAGQGEGRTQPRQETPPRRPGRGRTWAIAAGLVLTVAVAGVIWAQPRTRGSADETARRYLNAWSAQEYTVMRELVLDPPADFEQVHRGVFSALELDAMAFRIHTPSGVFAASTEELGHATFTATLTGPGPDFAYESRLNLVEHEHRWKVSWSPATVHPELKPGRTLRLVTGGPETVPILAADGSRIDTPGAPRSVRQLAGSLKPRFRDWLSVGRPTRIELVEDGRPVRTLAENSARQRMPLTTTLDPRVQRAGADALTLTGKPAALVALKASTGEILASVNSRGGFDRALMGRYPPGSTFTVVTASALLADGLSAEQVVSCPARRNVGGVRLRNPSSRGYGGLPFRAAFAHACDTTVGALAVSSLEAERLAKVAGDFGFGAPFDPGVPAVRADFPVPKDDAALASASIGQGRVRASPLNMAAVAAAIAHGMWQPPRLVPAEKVPTDGEARRPLEPSVTKALRSLLPAVVSEDPAHAVRFPPGTAGKAGSAEHGSGRRLSWFIGYRDDLAFSLVVEGGGAGSATAAPIAARFLKGLEGNPID